MKNIQSEYIVRSASNPSLVLCANGQFMPENMTGPGGMKVKIYKRRRNAKKVRGGYQIIVEEILHVLPKGN